MPNNLEQRANIDDVVVIELFGFVLEVKVTEIKEKRVNTLYVGNYLKGGEPCLFNDIDILKNLTTNVSYEK